MIILFILLLTVFTLVRCSSENEMEYYNKNKFKDRFENTCFRYRNSPGYNVNLYGGDYTKHDIETPDELDAYIRKFKGKTKKPAIFNNNLYNAILNNYKNDYIVIKAVYNFIEIDEISLEVFSKHKEFLLNEYLSKYFYSDNPVKDQYFVKISNVLANTVYSATRFFNANGEYSTTIAFMELVFKHRKPELDETLKEKLSIVYAEALFNQKGAKAAQDCLNNAIKEYNGNNEALLKKQLAEYGE